MQLHHAIVGMSGDEVQFVTGLMKFYKTPDSFIDAVINKDLMGNHIRLMAKVREGLDNGGAEKSLKQALAMVAQYEEKPLTRLRNFKWPWPSKKA